MQGGLTFWAGSYPPPPLTTQPTPICGNWEQPSWAPTARRQFIWLSVKGSEIGSVRCVETQNAQIGMVSSNLSFSPATLAWGYVAIWVSPHYHTNMKIYQQYI